MKCRLHKCHACCCYNIPFADGELERFSGMIVNPVIYTVPVGFGFLAYTAQDPKDNKCPFLRTDLRCNIYEHRPDVCRKFGQIKQFPCRFLKT